jgi:uncharacterized protein YqjF (DUF2071 family)
MEIENTGKILTHTTNRVYPLPERDWKYYQEWHNTLFYHWKVTPALLKEYIPSGLRLDTIDNMAWISIVAFEVKKMRLRNFPAIPYISNFHEVNLRTYVIKDGIPGIYMFSITTNKLIEIIISRLFVGIPYQQMQIKRNFYSIAWGSLEDDCFLRARFSYSNALVTKTMTDIWLSERHCLYETRNNNLYRYDIHHREWKLKKLTSTLDSVEGRAGGFKLNAHPDKMHYCRKLNVLLWGRKKVD